LLLIYIHSLFSYPDRPAKLPLWLAQDAGLFQKYGVKVEIKPAKSGEDLVARIARDAAQIYVATANWIVSGIGDGKDLVFFANTGYSVLKLVARPAISRPHDLKGKRVGTGPTEARTGSRVRRPSHAKRERVGVRAGARIATLTLILSLLWMARKGNAKEVSAIDERGNKKGFIHWHKITMVIFLAA
jgi:hypothetical protein